MEVLYYTNVDNGNVVSEHIFSSNNIVLTFVSSIRASYNDSVPKSYVVMKPKDVAEYLLAVKADRYKNLAMDNKTIGFIEEMSTVGFVKNDAPQKKRAK